MAAPWASPVAQMVKNLPANAGDAGDMSSIPGSDGSPGIECMSPAWQVDSFTTESRGSPGIHIHTHIHAAAAKSLQSCPTL